DKKGRRVVGYTLEIRQINTTLDTNTVVIDGKPQPPRVKGKQGVRKEEKSIPTNVSEKVAEYNAEKQVELSEVEKLKKELAKVKIAHTLDKLIPDLKDNEENTKKGEQIDLF